MVDVTFRLGEHATCGMYDAMLFCGREIRQLAHEMALTSIGKYAYVYIYMNFDCSSGGQNAYVEHSAVTVASKPMWEGDAGLVTQTYRDNSHP